MRRWSGCLRFLRDGLWVASGALLVVTIAAWARPLSLLGDGPDARAATARFQQALEANRLDPLLLDAMPALRSGVAAFEDRGFFERSRLAFPVSPRGLCRAVVRNLRGVRAGGSTIEQQTAKLLHRTGDRPGLRDKARELLLARWITSVASRDEVLAVYLGLSSARFVGGSTPREAVDRLALALFGLPMGKLGREEQLLLAATPRGLAWLRNHPQASLGRLQSAREWLTGRGAWDSATPSWLDLPGAVDPAATFSLLRSSDELLAGGRGADLDLTSAIESFRESLRYDVLARHPGTRVRAVLAVAGGGDVHARSGLDSASMRLSIGSLAKVEVLDLAVEALGPEAVRALPLAPARCVRWYWSRKRGDRSDPGRWCPRDAAAVSDSFTLDQAVARSVNTATAVHAIALPYLLHHHRPDLFADLRNRLSEPEWSLLDSPADRALSASVLVSLGRPLEAGAVPAELSYTPLQVAFLRALRERRAAGGLPVSQLPDDPTQIVGNSGSATIEQVAEYLHRRLFSKTSGCELSSTGALLALQRSRGTLRFLAARRPGLLFAGKTATSPHDDAALVGVALCLDGRPVVIAAGIRPVEARLPDGLHGSELLRPIAVYLDSLEELGRKVSSPQLPVWALGEPVIATPQPGAVVVVKRGEP